jgi:hypothetical protein
VEVTADGICLATGETGTGEVTETEGVTGTGVATETGTEVDPTPGTATTAGEVLTLFS